MSDNIDDAWDEERTIQRMGGQRTLIKKLAVLFLRDAPMQLREALNGIEQQDYDSSFIAMHSLKGTSSNLCTHRFENICAELLVALTECDWDRAAIIHHSLSVEYLKLEKQLGVFIKV